MAKDINERPEELAHLNLENLRAIRADVAALKTGQDTIKGDLLTLRKEVNGVRGELLRFEENLAAMGIQIDRINARFGLTKPRSDNRLSLKNPPFHTKFEPASRETAFHFCQHHQMKIRWRQRILNGASLLPVK